MRFSVVVGLLLLPGLVMASYNDRDEVRAFIAEMVEEQGFAEEALQAIFADAQRSDAILEAIARPAERVRPWYDYRCIFLTESRVAQGLEFWEENAAALARAEETYGVAAPYVVAIIGVETMYGRHKGRHRVLDALSTLAFDYPPRAAFFRRELKEFLILADEEGKDPRALYGSYAGAMGYGQFIPSSYRAYAVDFDGSGVRDIWDNRTDAIGSVANYLSVHGWRDGAPVVLRVGVNGEVDGALLNNGLTLPHRVSDLRSQGLSIPAAVAGDWRAALVEKELADGREIWLGLQNFYVITRYNRSSMYALAVHQLAAAIEAGRAGDAAPYGVCR
jgi:membrane-bound lytic murein transglycosylase B